MSASPKKQALATLGLLLATAICGSTFVLINRTVEVMDVYYFLFLRFSIAFVIMAAIFRRKLLKPSIETLKASLLLGVMLAIAFITQTEGLRFTSAANSSLITSLYMVMVPIFSAFYGKDRIDLFVIAGIALSLAGMYLLTHSNLTGANTGDWLTLACALACAWHIILTGKYSTRHKIGPLVAYQFLFMSILGGAMTIFRKSYTLQIPPIAIFSVLTTSLLATVLAMLLQVAAQRVIPPSRAALISSLEVVFGVGLAWTIGGETATTLAFAGACLMLTGTTLSEMRHYSRMLIERIVG